MPFQLLSPIVGTVILRLYLLIFRVSFSSYLYRLLVSQLDRIGMCLEPISKALNVLLSREVPYPKKPLPVCLAVRLAQPSCR